MAGADPEIQYHLTTDASLTGLEGVLFQLLNTSENTELTASLRVKQCIIMFISFLLTDTETRYSNTERECLVIIRSLAEVQ